jgi:hypothetical protein
MPTVQENIAMVGTLRFTASSEISFYAHENSGHK